MRNLDVLCLVVLTVMFPACTATDHLARLDQSSTGEFQHRQDVLDTRHHPGQADQKPGVLSMFKDQSDSTFQELFPVDQLRQPALIQGIRPSRLHHWHLGSFPSSPVRHQLRVSSRRKDLLARKGHDTSGVSVKHGRSRGQTADSQLTQVQDKHQAISKLWSNRCSFDGGAQTGLSGEMVLRPGQRSTRILKLRCPSQVERRKARGAENAWGGQLNSELSSLGLVTSNDVIYKNIGRLLGQLTGHPRQVSQLLPGTYSPDPAFASTQVNYKVIPAVAKLAAQETSDADGGASEAGVSESLDQDQDKSLVPGNYDYNNGLAGTSGGVSKRARNYKENIYAFLKQGPRHSQTVALQDLPRGSTLLRSRDKMERSSQHKKQQQSPLLPKPAPAPTDVVCEAETDGTMPMRCPSSPGTCLYDAMICDKVDNCPNGEDESFTLCVLRHWTVRWFHKFLPVTQRLSTP